MTDDRYLAGHRIAPRVPKVGEPLWTIRARDTWLSCELRSHGEWGWEAMVLRDNELSFSRRFDLRAMAEQWADLQRKAIESRGQE